MVHRVRRALRTRAVGHTGTLDPFATGLLVVLVGRATRLARFLDGQPKTYLATARLGIATDTDDLTGVPLEGGSGRSGAGADEIGAALAGFRGPHLQRPPAYSAKHVGGERSYALARRGEAVALEPVAVTVHAIDLVSVAGADVTFRVAVSAGTYIRAIARDLGERLGTGAHLVSLRRERIGSLDVRDAVALDAISAETELRPPQAALAHLPVHGVDANGAADVAQGRAVPAPGFDGATVAIECEGRLVAVAEGVGDRLQPRVVLEPA